MRDPRAAPVSISRNESIPETCAFYGIQDAISRCRFPRSCGDCLAMPGCFLTSQGRCEKATSLVNTSRGVNSRNVSSSSTNKSVTSTAPQTIFLAGTATLCGATDGVCTKCRQQFQQLAQSRDTADMLLETQSFCRGENGCLCIGLCEVADDVRAFHVYDSECAQPRPPLRSVNAVAPPLRQSLTSSHRDPRAPLVNVFGRKLDPESETCAFTSDLDLRGCRRPRSCQDCLQKPGCVVARYRCATMDEYIWDRDYRWALLGVDRSSTLYNASFPSSNTSYCQLADPVCSLCRAQFHSEYSDSPDEWAMKKQSSDFCVGLDGCVCIESCESPYWSTGEGVADTACRRIHGVVDESPVVPLVIGAIGVIVVLVLYVVYKYSGHDDSHDGRRPPQTRVLRHMLDDVPIVARLDLFGWRRFDERLRVKEEQLLQGDELVSPVTHPVDFGFPASAPDVDDDDSSAPTAQDPTALASAPFYYSVPHLEDPILEVVATPSAPDLDGDDECLWQRRWDETVTRRNSRRMDEQ